MKSRTIQPIHWDGRRVKCLDQRLLPFKEKWVVCSSVEQVARAIEDMVVRGAPLIGITAAYGVALAGFTCRKASRAVFEARVLKDIARLRKTRPTAVNLFWALDAMQQALLSSVALPSSERAKLLDREARGIHREDEALCDAIGDYGAKLLSSCRHVLTHCNTGALATGGDGTALAAITHAARKRRGLHVWVDETRPYLQGARLTAYELHHAKIPFDLITDNMAAYWMGQGKVDAVIVGADRIASNGDTANKIGTYSLAVLCRYHRIPFYVAAPTSTFDLTLKQGSLIPIEERRASEVTQARGIPITRADYPVRNPSFDVTPGDLIAAIVCEQGICRRPYGSSLRAAWKKGAGR